MATQNSKVKSQNVKTEHSAGGVVYKTLVTNRKSPTTLYLIGLHSGYHKWVLPKGLIEPGESPQATALREVQEEMGITANIIGDTLLHTENYTYTATFKPSLEDTRRRVAQYSDTQPGDTLVHKTVDFYLMAYVSGDPKNHDWEMAEAGWFTFTEALKKLAFPGEKLALQKARDKIQSRA